MQFIAFRGNGSAFRGIASGEFDVNIISQGNVILSTKILLKLIFSVNS